MTIRYQLASLFAVRMAGTAYEPLGRIATTAAAAQARTVLARQGELEQASRAAAAALDALAPAPPFGLATDIRRALRQGRPLPRKAATLAPELGAYARAQQEHLAAQEHLADTLAKELAALRRELPAVLPELRRFSAFCSPSVQKLFARVDDLDEEGLDENSRGRETERTLLHYLQRLAAKNDTFSEFGPGGWGRVEPQRRGLGLAPRPGIARRYTYLEKWVSEEVVRIMNRDPAVRTELAPRQHPAGRIEDGAFVREDTGARIELTEAELALVRSCDGHAPAHALGEAARLAKLADEGVLLWELEVVSLDAQRFDRLVEQVRAWRQGPAREHWLLRLERLALFPQEFAQQTEPEARCALMAQAKDALESLGGTARATQRTLYRASNPIAEECHRDCDFTVGGDLAAQLAEDAAPWLDLWRDTTDYVCHQVNAHLVRHFEQAPASARRSLAAFLRHCEQAGLSLTGNAYSDLVRREYSRVQQAFCEMLTPPESCEWVLTAQDCEFVRRMPDYRPWHGCGAWPAPDLQLAARSLAAIERGEYRWILGELHLPRVLLTNSRYWSCPDHALLHELLEQATDQQRLCQWLVRIEDRVSHVLAHWPEVFPERWTALGVERMLPRHRWLSPVDAAPYLDEPSGELRIREAASGRDLGSFVAPWNAHLAIGTHPFVFQRPPHLPRMRVGRVIVQRRCWELSRADLPGLPFAGVSSELVLAVERLRAAKDLPRWVFIRPTDDVLLRFHADGRDKDVKPAYIDLESYPFLGMLARTLAKYGKIEVTEMMPAPDELCWQEADGHRTFELRGLFLPRRE